MPHMFICPECRSEHSEPAEAHFLLTMLCVDCVMALDYHASRLEIESEIVELVPAAA